MFNKAAMYIPSVTGIARVRLADKRLEFQEALELGKGYAKENVSMESTYLEDRRAVRYEKRYDELSANLHGAGKKIADQRPAAEAARAKRTERETAIKAAA